MPRLQAKSSAIRKYSLYSEEALDNALRDVASGKLSYREAQQQYGVSRQTICNKMHGKHGKKVGRPTALTEKEEESIAKKLVTCSSWGYPLNTLDLRYWVKAYLDSAGRSPPQFKHNLPGDDWCKSFLDRHKETLRQRVSANISRSRSNVSTATLNAYFDNLETSVEGIQPSNVFNYDESNLSDDPGRKKAIHKRGVKYPERIINSSKSCITIMMCEAADGTILPLYVVYKAQHLWNTWAAGGPRGAPFCLCSSCKKGTRYGCSAHGWFDQKTFSDWFFAVFLPHAVTLQGPKILLGDNLASHFMPEVIAACEENDIRFVCFPPNATHLCQPLDVATFRPIKMKWRLLLAEWKSKNPSTTGIPKDKFPNLLTMLFKELASCLPDAVRSGFKTCGIVPLNRDAVLSKMPDYGQTIPAEDAEEALNNSLLTTLKRMRYGDKPNVRQKRKLLKVQPGKSVTSADLAISDNEASSDAESADTQVSGPSRPTPAVDSEEEEEEEVESEAEESQQGAIKEGHYVVANFPGRKNKVHKYVCVIQRMLEDNELSVMALKALNKNKTMFVVDEEDISFINKNAIVLALPQPKMVVSGNRISYRFPKSLDVAG